MAGQRISCVACATQVILDAFEFEQLNQGGTGARERLAAQKAPQVTAA